MSSSCSRSIRLLFLFTATILIIIHQIGQCGAKIVVTKFSDGWCGVKGDGDFDIFDFAYESGQASPIPYQLVVIGYGQVALIRKAVQCEWGGVKKIYTYENDAGKDGSGKALGSIVIGANEYLLRQSYATYPIRDPIQTHKFRRVHDPFGGFKLFRVNPKRQARTTLDFGIFNDWALF